MKKLLPIALMMASIVGCKKNDEKATSYKINEVNSKIEWKGSATDHFHVGSFDVSGSLTSTGSGNISGGDFIIPIASIKDFDLPQPVNQTLLDDLLSENFFHVVVNPNASFHITKVAPYSTSDTSAVAGANYLVTGDFTMVGQTHPISFPFKVSAVGDSLTAEAKFNIDRTKWGMTIYSDPTQALFIYPDVNIHMTLKAGVNK